mgnify:CR=1 FL=1
MFFPKEGLSPGQTDKTETYPYMSKANIYVSTCPLFPYLFV